MPSTVLAGVRSVTNLVCGRRAAFSRIIANLCGLGNGMRGTFVGAVHGLGIVGSMTEALGAVA